MTIIIENKYQIEKLIGEGMYGKIFLAKNKNTNEAVAVKIDSSILLKNEARIYCLFANTKGIPSMRSFGREGNYNYLVMDKLGISLEDLLVSSKGKISLKTTLIIGIQMIKRVESIHAGNIIHRDIKPENFLLGATERSRNTVHIIDFGLSKLYSIQETHVEMKTDRVPIGTLDFISINVHRGYTPSRRDDLESVGYILLYLFLGKLPWIEEYDAGKEKDISGDNQESVERKIYEIKNSCCLWNIDKDIPGELITYIQYCRNLQYADTPNYSYLCQLLTNLFSMKQYTIGNNFIIEPCDAI